MAQRKKQQTSAQRRTRGRAAPKRSLLPFYLALGLVGILGATIIIVRALNPAAEVTVAVPPRSPLNAPVGQTEDGFWYKGDPNAPVKVIEYADYECPGCFVLEAALVKSEFDQKYVETGKVQYIYHELPLTSIHKSAQLTAEVARCAGDQGLFWPVHDALFDTQRRWSGQSNAEELIFAAGAAAGADRAKLRACVDDGTHAAKVKAATNEAFGMGYQSTPTITVNGKPIAIRTDDYAASLIAMVEAELAAKANGAVQ